MGWPQYMGGNDFVGGIEMEKGNENRHGGNRCADPAAQTIECAFFLLDILFYLLARIFGELGWRDGRA